MWPIGEEETPPADGQSYQIHLNSESTKHLPPYAFVFTGAYTMQQRSHIAEEIIKSALSVNDEYHFSVPFFAKAPASYVLYEVDYRKFTPPA